MRKGIGASQGIGIGRAIHVQQQELTYGPKRVTDKEAEKARLQAAIDQFVQETQALADTFGKRLNARDGEILTGHIAMIQDPFLLEEMNQCIEDGQCAEYAADSMLELARAIFLNSEEELIRQRATDVADIKGKLLALLLGVEQMDLSHLPEHSVLVAHDLTPSMTAEMDHAHVVGIITESGGMTSHSAILSRALEIPAVLSVPNALADIPDGAPVIVDGTQGQVIVEPSPAVLADYCTRSENAALEKQALEPFRGRPTQTKDGKRLQVLGNIGTPQEAAQAVEQDCEGIGLFRTEFLYMNQGRRPDEETQYQAYKQVCQALGGKPVIIRTLDVGGDKDIPYLRLEKEENPFLGYRAVRYCLGNKTDYRTQLKALIRAGADGGDCLWIMIPMVATVREVQQVRALAEDICQETGLPMPKIGTMIETPAAMLMADTLAKHCDFFSIGTNDLIQYIMAADRGNQKVAYLYRACDPAVLRALHGIIQAGVRAEIPVGLCGEAASDPLLLPVLLGFGLEKFSVTPAAALKTRRALSLWSVTEAQEVARHVLTLETAEDVEAYLTKVRKA